MQFWNNFWLEVNFYQADTFVQTYKTTEDSLILWATELQFSLVQEQNLFALGTGPLSFEERIIVLVTLMNILVILFHWFHSLYRLPHVLGACSVEDLFLQPVEEMYRANTETYLPAFSWKHGAGTQQRCCYNTITLSSNCH